MMVDFAFLDSGTGGIPYLTYLKGLRPDASCIYVGDTANFPYGEKTHEQIVKCVLNVISRVIERFNPKAIVIACNTMSVNTLDVLREAFPETHFVGTVPAIKLASAVSKKRRIGLLATSSTINNPYNIDLKNHFASDCELVLRADPELISFIEKKSFTATEEECIRAVTPAVDFFKSSDCDVMILGCTHFTNLAELIQKVSGDQMKIVDSREGVCKRALSLVNEDDKTEAAKSRLFITGFENESDKSEYDVICKRFDMEWGGKL